MNLRVGTLVAHYEILEQCGGGGMGVVYRARDTKLDRIVALKFLTPEGTRDPDSRKRFVREAQSASALQHPNICTIHDIDETEDGQIFIVMDYYAGSTLKDRSGKSALGIDEALDLTIQILQGLSKAHERGIVHRDIKPANILLTDDGLVKILDFGLAKLSNVSMVTKEGTTIGTVAYMSPEQAQGLDVDHRSDIWSVGALLYQLLTGTSPFWSDYDQAVIYKILNEAPRPLQELRPDAGVALERIVAKALEKNPNERFQSCEEFASALQVLRAPTASSQTASAPRPSMFKNRGRIIAAGAVLAIALAASLMMLLDHSQVFDTIAVLPLENLSNNPDQEYFSDGMTDAIITELAQIKGFTKVSSRTSVMQFKDVRESLPNIAKALGVSAIVEGSVLLDGGDVAINVKLIDGSTEQNLWARSYQRDLRNVISLQREIARDIAGEIRVSLTAQDQTRLTTQKPVDPEAHTLYLKGMHLLDEGMTRKEVVERSMEYFRESLEHDSTYAPSWAGLASSIMTYAAVGYESLQAAAPAATAAAQRAYELDPDYPQASAALGFIKLMFEWDWYGALEHFEQALRLNPHDGLVLDQYSYLLILLGRPDEAMIQIRRAQELNPLSPAVNIHAARMYNHARQYDRAIEECNKVLGLNPDDIFALWVKGCAYSFKGEYDEAIAVFLSRKVPDPSTNWMLGYTYGRAGDTTEARRVLDFLLDKSKRTFIQPAMIAAVYVGLGAYDKALDMLERAYEARDTWMETLTISPMWDQLRDHPRFKTLVRKLNLPTNSPGS